MDTRYTIWYFSAWNFKTRHTKLDSPLGKNLWDLNYLFQDCIIKESRASEVVKSRSCNSLIFKVKNKVRGIFFSEKYMEFSCKSKFGHFTTMFHQFQKMRPVLYSVFTQKFNFDCQNFIASFLKKSIFSASEAWLSSIVQY